MTKDENNQILLMCKREFIAKLFISVILVFLLLIIPIFYSFGIDYINDLQFNKAYIIFVVLGIISLIYRYVEILNQKFYYVLYSKLYKIYMNKGLEKTCNNSLYSLSRFSLSEYSNILSEDFELLSDYYSTLIIRFVEILQFAFIIVYFFYINLIIGLITFILSILIISYLFYFNKYISKTAELRKLYNDNRISLFQEVFLSIKEIKGTNIFSKIRLGMEEGINSYIESNNKLNIDKYNLRQSSLAFVDIFKVVCLLYCVYLILNDYITIGILTVVYSYYTKLSELFTSIILLNESISNVKVAKKRIYKLFQYAYDKTSIVSDYNDILGDIIFENVLYGNKNNPLLNKVSFKIKHNTFNILIGHKENISGIYALLLKFNRKHQGNIYIDNIEIDDYSHKNISNIVGFMMEKPIFFKKSIKDNLMLFDNSFESIINICKYLEIHDLIMNLKDGYSTILYNNANNLDDDLKYMLSFAKILLKKSKIILIDDFLDNLSKYYRDKIWDVLTNLKVEHTIIFITKNVKYINNKNVDKILFLDKNIIVGVGRHHELYKNVDKYRDFIEKL